MDTQTSISAINVNSQSSEFLARRTIASLKLEGISGCYLIQSLWLNGDTHSRTVSKWLLNISKDGNSTCLDNLCSLTHTVKFYMCISLCPLPLGLMLGTTERNLSLHWKCLFKSDWIIHTNHNLLVKVSRLNKLIRYKNNALVIILIFSRLYVNLFQWRWR